MGGCLPCFSVFFYLLPVYSLDFAAYFAARVIEPCPGKNKHYGQLQKFAIRIGSLAAAIIFASINLNNELLS